MWRKYFNFIKLVPGKVVVPKFGTIDFSDNSLSVEFIKKLYDSGLQYLELTPEGKQKFSGIEPETTKEKKPSAKRRKKQ